jgi:hypothetical protein
MTATAVTTEGNPAMRLTKKIGTVSLITGALLAALGAGASPASANTCAGPVYNPLDPSSFVNVCADAGTYDADPTSAGFGVRAAASASIELSGYTHFCTGYYGAGVNLDFGKPIPVVPDTIIEGPSDCT